MIFNTAVPYANKYITLLAFLFLIVPLSAQEAVLTSGETYSSGSGSVSFSAGQVAYSEISGSGGTASEGVQQAFEIFPMPAPEQEALPKEVLPLFENLEVTVFPNPTQGLLNLELSGTEDSVLNYHLYDLQGRLLRQEVLRNTSAQIQLDNLPSGTYLLRIQSENIPLKIFKIIRN